MKAAVLRELNYPLSVDEFIESGEVGFGQVGVRILCAGICGAQLQEIDGHKGDPSHLPHFLGHEACAIVEQIGLGVNHVKLWDKVILHWRKRDGFDVNGKGCDDVKAGPVTCFSEYAIVSANRVTKVPDDLPDDLACLLGCCLSTALGVIENEAKVKFGESVLVIGCGGVGLAMILAAKLANAHPIKAVDLADKREIVESLGAEFYQINPYEMFDVIIDTTGTFSEFGALGPSGRYIAVGQPSKSAIINLKSSFFSGNGQRIQATQGGCFSPGTDIPRYVNLWRSGALDDYKKLITHRISLDEINDGIELMRKGKSGRVLIEMNK